MKKLFCLFLVLLSTSFMFGATIFIPRTHLRSGYGDFMKFEDVKNWNITIFVHFLHQLFFLLEYSFYSVNGYTNCMKKYFISERWRNERRIF